MKFIIAPAKRMKQDFETGFELGIPRYLSEAQRVAHWVQALTFEQQAQLWGTNTNLTLTSRTMFEQWSPTEGLSPAILSYDGIQYTYMAPGIFNVDEYEYLQENTRILSGLYGILRPLDGIAPYRLEMQAHVQIDGVKNLYDFWGPKLYEGLEGDSCIINLASAEYAKCIKHYLKPTDNFVTILFCELVEGYPKQKGVYVKMARGEMMRYAAQRGAAKPEDLQSFNWRGYKFCPERSSEHEYLFLRTSQ